MAATSSTTPLLLLATHWTVLTIAIAPAEPQLLKCEYTSMCTLSLKLINCTCLAHLCSTEGSFGSHQLLDYCKHASCELIDELRNECNVEQWCTLCGYISCTRSWLGLQTFDINYSSFCLRSVSPLTIVP